MKIPTLTFCVAYAIAGCGGATSGTLPSDGGRGDAARAPRATGGGGGGSAAAADAAARGGGGASATDAGDPDPPFPPPANDECNMIEIRARADATGAPFPVPAGTSELIQLFHYHVDLGGATQALAFHPLMDNTQLVHHWILYMVTKDQSSQNGTSEATLSFHSDGIIMAAWAPGAGDWNMPPDAGEQISITGGGDFYLEVHYNNFTTENRTDRSGVQVCAAKAARPHTAGVSWLGNDLFFIPAATADAPIAGRCKPNPPLTAPVHILSSWPNMNKLGRRMTAEIDRADGSVESLFDHTFRADQGRLYRTPATINPGDSILTTCHFENPTANVVSFGVGSTAELCFNFTLAYPAGKLINLGGGVHNNECVGAP
jgi:hypothetical protein